MFYFSIEIVSYAHSKGIAVIVDEAHGAHLNLPPFKNTSKIKHSLDDSREYDK